MRYVVFAIVLAVLSCAIQTKTSKRPPPPKHMKAIQQPPRTVRLKFHETPNSSTVLPRLPPPNYFPSEVAKPKRLQ